jgi:hypothetical protein
LTTGGAGGTNQRPVEAIRRPTMWRLSNGQALIFIAAVVVMVTVLVLLAR